MDETYILVTDDEKEIADLVEIYLTSAGYQVLKAYSAAEGLKLLEQYPVRLAILDIMMPDMDGIEMCRKIREKSNIPVIFLSAKSTELDKIRGLGNGADDYVTKPFSPLELSARVKSQLRRYTELNPANITEEDSDEITIRGITINRTKHLVIKDGEDIRLTPHEFDILCLLASHPGKVFGIEEIFQKVWNEIVYDSENTVMVHIRRLRTKIGDLDKDNRIIVNVWGKGYKIDE